MRVLGCGPGGVVEDAAAADGGELVAVAEERDPGAGLIGDAQQGAGGVLVEHAGLVDEQQVPGVQPRPDIGSGLGPGVEGLAGRAVGAGPGAVAVPAPPVLVGQPGGGERLGAGLQLGDVGSLQRGRDHHHAFVAHLRHRAGHGQRGGLPDPGRTLDHQQTAGADQRGDHQPLGPVQLLPAEPGADRGGPAGLVAAGGEPLDHVGLHGEHPPRRQRPHMPGHIAAVQQPHAPAGDAGGEVLGQLPTHPRIGDHTQAGDDPFGLATQIGGVPRRPAGTQPHHCQLRARVTVHPADRRPGPSAGPSPSAIDARADLRPSQGRFAIRSARVPAGSTSSSSSPQNGSSSLGPCHGASSTGSPAAHVRTLTATSWPASC